MPNINDSIIDFNDFNAEPQLLRDIQDGKAIAFYSFAHLLLNADGTPYTMSKGVQLSGNYDTLNALKAAFPKGNSNLYIVNEDSKIYYWNGADWVVGGGINVTYASTLELDSPSESTSGTLTSTQLNTLKSNTFTQIKLGNFIYRKEAVISTKAIYRCITDDFLYVISVNTDTGSWVKTSQELPEQMWTVDDIPADSIDASKLGVDAKGILDRIGVVNYLDSNDFSENTFPELGWNATKPKDGTYTFNKAIYCGGKKKMYITNSWMTILFYDANKKNVGGYISTGTKEHDVPQGAVWVRIGRNDMNINPTTVMVSFDKPLPNEYVPYNKLSVELYGGVGVQSLDTDLKETIFKSSSTLTEVVNRYEYSPASANLYTVNIESGKLKFSGTPSTKATLFVYYGPSIKFEASKPVYLNIYADETSVVPREYYITIGGKQMELYPLLNKSTELKIDTTAAHDKFAIYNNALSAINFSGYIWLSTKPMSTFLSPNAVVSRIGELEKVVYKKSEDKPIIIFNSDMGATLDNRVKVLEEFGFKGTFCDNGTKWTKDVLKRLLSKGHDIALYGGGNVPSANQPSDWLNEEQWRTYLTANLKAMNDNGYYLPTLFGCTTHKGTEIIKKVTKELGFKYMSCGYITPGDSWETSGTKFYTWNTNSPNEYVIAPTKIEDITPEWFDTTFLPQGKVLSIFNHTVIDGEITNPTLQVSTTKYREIVSKVKELVDAGKVEVLTMREYYNRYHEDGTSIDFNRIMTMAV